MSSNPYGGGTPIIPSQVPPGQLPFQGGGTPINPQPTGFLNGIDQRFNNWIGGLFGGTPSPPGGSPINQTYLPIAPRAAQPVYGTAPRPPNPSSPWPAANQLAGNGGLGPMQQWAAGGGVGGGLPLNPATNNPYYNAAGDPNAWTNAPLWQYTPGGAGPFAGVAPENWQSVADQLGVAMPWVQQQQQANQQQFVQNLQSRGFTADQAQQQWANNWAQRQNSQALDQQSFDNMYRTGQAQRDQNNFQQNYGANRSDQAFNQWLATQQLGQNGAQQSQSAQQQAFQQDYQNRGFTADQSQIAWQNQFATGQAGQAQAPD